ncbi:MAG: hypothetical protein NTW59_05120 [Candidatus Diapherotrites archaeon]|nr:hypothetical protein [Candidatus Diapherotrites archaeon]
MAAAGKGLGYGSVSAYYDNLSKTYDAEHKTDCFKAIIEFEFDAIKQYCRGQGLGGWLRQRRDA